MQSINLIPEQEVQVQTQEKAVKFSTLFSIAVIAIIGLVAAYDLYRTYSINSQIKNLEGEITAFRQQITSLAQVEVNARNLDKKFNLLKDIFANRELYSLLTTEILARKPDGIVIDSMTLQKGSKLNVSGHADNYISIAGFTNNMVNTDYEKGDPTLKALFTTVTLNSVSLEKNKNIVRFSINIDVNSNLLKRK